MKFSYELLLPDNTWHLKQLTWHKSIVPWCVGYPSASNTKHQCTALWYLFNKPPCLVIFSQHDQVLINRFRCQYNTDDVFLRGLLFEIHIIVLINLKQPKSSLYSHRDIFIKYIHPEPNSMEILYTFEIKKRSLYYSPIYSTLQNILNFGYSRESIRSINLLQSFLKTTTNVIVLPN